MPRWQTARQRRASTPAWVGGIGVKCAVCDGNRCATRLRPSRPRQASRCRCWWTERTSYTYQLTPCRHTTENGSRSGQPPSPYHSAFSDWFRIERIACTAVYGIVSDRIEERVVSCRIVLYCIVGEVLAGSSHSGGIKASRVAIRWASGGEKVSKLCEATAQRKTVADRHGSGNGSGRGERTSRDAIKPAPVCVCVLYLCLDCFWSGMAQTDGLPWGWPCLVRAGFWGREFDGRPRGVKSNQNGSIRRGLAAGSAPSNLSGYLGLCL